MSQTWSRSFAGFLPSAIHNIHHLIFSFSKLHSIKFIKYIFYNDIPSNSANLLQPLRFHFRIRIDNLHFPVHHFPFCRSSSANHECHDSGDHGAQRHRHKPQGRVFEHKNVVSIPNHMITVLVGIVFGAVIPGITWIGPITGSSSFGIIYIIVIQITWSIRPQFIEIQTTTWSFRRIWPRSSI